jgi:uncharacterized protein (TIGR00299 family) protein
MSAYHLDLHSGLAGDMFLGACLDLGMPLEVLHDVVARLGLPGVAVEARKARRGGFAGTRFRVLLEGKPLEGPDPEERGQESASADSHGHEHPHDHPHDPEHAHGHSHDHSHDQDHGHSHDQPHPEADLHSHGHSHSHTRGLREIRELIVHSALSDAVKGRALRLFQRLGEAEAKAHGTPLEEIHFHEVGAVDSIVDLVGAAAAIEFLAPERLTATPVNVGSGTVRIAHGEVPIPAPATAELLRGVPIYGGPGGELTTPTGAVLIAELVDDFVDLPALRLEGVGYGLGKKELAHQPNAVRLLRGVAHAPGARAEVMVLESEIDNLSGEGFGFLMERLLESGALDAYLTPVQMKKGRPGTLVTALCRRDQLEGLAAVLLAETGSLGCRYHAAARWEAEREVAEVETPFGTVRVKRATLGGRPLAAAPEYEDCRRIARERGLPWREVYRAALVAAS